MAYKTIVSLDSDITIALGGRDKKTGKLNPTEVEGYLLGSRTDVPSKKSKTGFCCIHYFHTDAGVIGVWGKTDMDKQMRNATRGLMTLVKFVKMVPTPSGNDMYKYSVAQDADNVTTEIPELPTAMTAEYHADLETAVAEEEDDAEVEAAELAAAEARAAQKAKVQALLAKKKTA